MIHYDNLKPAVLTCALGRERFDNPRFIALRSHYGFDSFYSLPGLEGAHEKGGVEGEVGRFRRRHLTPVPHLPSLAALNEAMAAHDAKDDARRIGARVKTVGDAFARELPLLNPLPDNEFDDSMALSCRVDAKARTCMRQSYDSVPASYAGRRVQVVRLSADRVTAVDGTRVIAEHVRSLHKAARTWCWITTWRSWSASPAPWPWPPRCPRPEPPGRSRQRIKPFGTPPDGRWPTKTGPVPWSGRCCCTGLFRRPRWRMPWPRRLAPAASMRTCWPSRLAPTSRHSAQP